MQFVLLLSWVLHLKKQHPLMITIFQDKSSIDAFGV